MTDLVAQELPVLANLDRPMSVSDLLRQGQIIHDVLTQAMVEGIHYGKVPGTGNKPTLLQPGAEKICATFRLAPKARVEDLSEPDRNRYRYRVAVGLYTIREGLFVGEAIGEATSDEEKYQWEAAICHEQWELTDPDNRRIKFKKDNSEQGYEKIEQIRRNAADLSNTVVKIAFKRAFVSAARGCTAASDLLDVDLDEPVVADLAKDEQQATAPSKPKAKAPPAPSFAYGKFKGTPITDEIIPLDYLEFMADQIAGTIQEINANPKHKRAKFKAKDQLFLAALDAEIKARRAKNPKQPETPVKTPEHPAATGPGKAQPGPPGDTTRTPFTDTAWAEFINTWEEEWFDLYVATKEAFTVQSGHDLSGEQRLAFYDQMSAAIAKATKK